MATPFSAQITYPSGSYTIPANKTAVANFFSAMRGYQPANTNVLFVNVYLNGGVAFTMVAPGAGPHVGPFVFNAGDVISWAPDIRGVAQSWLGSTGLTPKFGMNGELYDISSTKIPFSAAIKQNSSTYTVPSGKIARFMTFQSYSTNPTDVVGQYCIAVDGVDIMAAGPPGITSTFLFYQPFGPIIADAGSVISVSNTIVNTVGGAFLNGWLFNK